MKRVLIISPHFPPSNLAAVHRSRLFAKHLPSYGWDPYVLMVDEKYYEEQLDNNLLSLVDPSLKIEKAGAFPLTRPRLIGDIGLRAFFQLYRKAKAMIKKEKIDFLYIPIPSFYVALLGRWLHQSTGIRYGIDYIDPWVHHFPGSDRLFSRHWFSTRLARWLEPIAVKNAALITGVAEGYYKGVGERNPHLLKNCIFGAMPYGGEVEDHRIVAGLGIRPYLFESGKDRLQMVYAGAMLPKAYGPLEAVFQSVQENPGLFRDVEFHFIGTGRTPNDPEGYNIKPLAEKYGLWQTVVFEYPRRIPYLDVLVHLDAADGIFVLGSTEPHYTPSKVYQAVLSGKPVAAVLHGKSTATEVVRGAKAGIVLDFDGEQEVDRIRTEFSGFFAGFRTFHDRFDPSAVDMTVFNTYSAGNVTKQLAGYLNLANNIQ
ncbi:hypothetical protein ACQ86N_42585 [Puia sp. P3]|uniref:hypothetical protein n=1 Tax=Puia sp. P3 TaxID=3423952 RepID=UPI003D66BE56